MFIRYPESLLEELYRGPEKKKCKSSEYYEEDYVIEEKHHKDKTYIKEEFKEKKYDKEECTNKKQDKKIIEAKKEDKKKECTKDNKKKAMDKNTSSKIEINELLDIIDEEFINEATKK